MALEENINTGAANPMVYVAGYLQSKAESVDINDTITIFNVTDYF